VIVTKDAVMVVGATGGLGDAVVRALREAGFLTIFTGRNQRALDRLAGEFPGTIPRLFDASDAVAAQSLVSEIDSEYGLAAYVHLAGGFAMGPAIDQLSKRDWDAMFEMNWESLRNGAAAAFGRFRPRGSGSVVTVASLAALSGGAGMAPYAVSKAAVVAFTRCLAEEGKALGIRANCIIPGILDTRGNREAMPGADRSGWVSCERVASTIVFLCSPASAGVNGATFLMKGAA
jgi:NAD(P)-dependent dehydrogenase (short-subunit alcohol dehydrogenase family)